MNTYIQIPDTNSLTAAIKAARKQFRPEFQFVRVEKDGACVPDDTRMRLPESEHGHAWSVRQRNRRAEDLAVEIIAEIQQSNDSLPE